MTITVTEVFLIYKEDKIIKSWLISDFVEPITSWQDKLVATYLLTTFTASYRTRMFTRFRLCSVVLTKGTSTTSLLFVPILSHFLRPGVLSHLFRAMLSKNILHALLFSVMPCTSSHIIIHVYLSQQQLGLG